MSSSQGRSFSGKKLSARERREARRHAEERARARAEALAISRGEIPRPEQVPPSSNTRNRPVGVPGAGLGRGAPHPVRARASVDFNPGVHPDEKLPPLVPMPSPPPGTKPFMHGSGGAVESNPFAGQPSGHALGRGADRLEEGALTLWGRITGQWGPRLSLSAVIVGLLLALVSACVGLAVGAPVLGHEGRPIVAIAGAAGAGMGGFLAQKGWRNSHRRASLVMAIVCLLLGSAFTVGTLTNPVVIDGEVFLSTSSTAKSFALAEEVRTDLLFLADADRYLTYNAAQAGARHREYPVLLEKLEEMSTKYTFLGESPADLPDELFVDVIERMTASSYWGARAVQSKMETIEEDNAKSQSSLIANRGLFAESVIGAGESLRGAVFELDLPLEQMGTRE